MVHLGSAAPDGAQIVKSFTRVDAGDSLLKVDLYCGTNSGRLVSEVYLRAADAGERTRPVPGTYSTDLPLTGLSISPGTLHPAFSRDILDYYVSDVPYENRRVTVATSAKPGYYVTLDHYWGDADWNTPGIQVDLHEGENSFDFIGRASSHNGIDDFSYTRYSLTVKRAATPSRSGPPSLTIFGSIITDYAENGDSPVATYAVADAEDDTITWSLSGDDSGHFSISDTGELAFNTAPDYENPADANGDNIYQATIQASDGTDTGTLGIAVTVTNEHEWSGWQETTPPELSTATVDGKSLTLTYNEALDETSEPAASVFTVTVNSATREVDNVSVEGATVTLTLASAVASGDTVSELHHADGYCCWPN